MDSDPRFFETKNGLRVAYEEYGDPLGEPVIFCHGWPSSRLQAAQAHQAACELGVGGWDAQADSIGKVGLDRR